jgi:hypothetical protein
MPGWSGVAKVSMGPRATVLTDHALIQRLQTHGFWAIACVLIHTYVFPISCPLKSYPKS